MKSAKYSLFQCSLGLAALLAFRSSGQQPGNLDPAFRYTPGAGATVSSYAIAPDGKIVVAGVFTNYHGQTRNGVARLNADGSLDTTFDPKAGPGPTTIIIPGVLTNTSPGLVSFVEVQADGRVLAAGSFSTWTGAPRNNMVRLNTDGSLDLTFTPAIDFGGQMLAEPGGKILVAGKANQFKPARKTGLGRMNADGSLDTTFVDSALGTAAGLDFGQFTVLKFVRQTDGKIIVLAAGSKSAQVTYVIGRLNADGSHDTSFHAGQTTSNGGPTAIDLDGSGRVLVGNVGAKFDGQNVGKVFRLLADGTLDTTYTYTLTGTSVSGVAAFPDGSAIISGAFDRIFGTLVRIRADGSHDTAYGLTNTIPSGTIFSAALLGPKIAPNGKVFAYGSLVTLSGIQVAIINSVFRLTDTTGGSVGGTAPTITTPPASLAVDLGKTAKFSVLAAGTAPLSYQWRKDSNPIPGATNDTLTITNAAASDGGGYSVVVTNLAGSATSTVATLTVNPPPLRFVTEPQTAVFLQGTPAQLTAVVEGPPPFTFQWFKNGRTVQGATSISLDFPNPQKTNEGSYTLEVKNASSTIRSGPAQVTVVASAPSWIVTSQNDGLGTMTDLWQDGLRGVVAAGNYFPAPAGLPEFSFAGVTFARPAALNGFIVRIDDAGTLLWAQTFIGNLSGSLSAITQVAVAADAAGNVFAAGQLAGVGEISGLRMTNNAAQGTFLVKLDLAGKGLWARVITGNLYQRELAVDPEGNVILTGRYTSQLEAPGAVLTAEPGGAGAVFKFGSDGSTKWGRSYRKNDTVGGTVDIYNVAADASGIYLLGSYNQSIKFGAFSLKILAPPFRDLTWLGKLDANGQEIWLRGVRGSVPNDLGLGANSIWTIGADDPPGRIVLSGFAKDGNTLTNSAVASASSIRGTGVGVAAGDRPIFGGDASGIAGVAGISIGVGTSPISLWAAAGNSGGWVRDARLPGFVDSPRVPAALVGEEMEASSNGSLYFAGAWGGILNMNSTRRTNSSQRVFVAKVAGFPNPFAPVIINQPASQLSRLGESRALSCNAKGGELTFTWLKNGKPIPETNLQIVTSVGLPGAMASTLTLIGLTSANAGDYTCVVSNSLGVASSSVARIEIGAAPQIITQPSAQRINVGQSIELSVEATGGDLRYQWLKNGASIPNATNATFTVGAAGVDDTAKYTVTVFNGLGQVDSVMARVLVCSGAPEAVFLGRPWVKIVDDAMSVPGYTNLLGDWKTIKPRFTLRNKTVHLAAHAGEALITSPFGGKFSQSLGSLLRWRNGVLDTLVFTNTTAPDGTKFLDVFYPTDETDGAMNFSGYSRDGDHFALYEIRGGQITQLADNSTVRPRGGGTFTGFGSLVRQGSVLTFGAGSTLGAGHYAIVNGVIKVLADEAADLPGLAGNFAGLPSNFVGFDGTSLVFAALDLGLTPKPGIYRADLAGNLVKIADIDTTASGSTRKFTRFGASDVAGGYVFFSTDRGLYAAAPDGTLTGLGGSDILSAASPDLVYFASGASVVRVKMGGAVPEEVLPDAAQMDCRQVRSVWQVDAQGDDIAIGVDFTDGSTGIFANLRPASASPGPQLGQAIFVRGQLQFALPTEAGKSYQVEFRATLNGAWTVVQTITGDGTAKTLTFAVSGRSGFYRVTWQ